MFKELNTLFSNRQQQLEITSQELSQLTGIKYLKDLPLCSITQEPERLNYFIRSRVKQTLGESQWARGTYSLLIGFFSYLLALWATKWYGEIALEKVEGLIVWICVTIAVASFFLLGLYIRFSLRLKINKLAKKPQLKTLRRLLEEVDKYNNIVKPLEELSKIKESVIKDNTNKTLIPIRSELVEALKIEKIRRNNPNFDSSSLYSELASLKTWQMSNRGHQLYGQQIEEAMAIGFAAQEEIKKLTLQ
ncbi:MAG: hypothetical protein QNJ54_37130 [Prochloraceae cyanobacterium]|nr:hypothetical protein [Prochloraceae cyanobacterium]